EECVSFWRIPPEEHRDWYWFNYVSPIWGPEIWEEPVGIGGLTERVCASIGAEAGKARLYIPIEAKLDNCELPGIFLFHHAAHAASSYYSSQQHEAIIVTHDGGTGLESGFVFHGLGNELRPVAPHFLECGEFYDYTAVRLGFHLIGGAGKLMGLASYGQGLLDDILPPGDVADWKAWLVRSDAAYM